MVFTTQELAEYLKVSKSTIMRHLKEIPHYKIGGQLRFKKSVIDALLGEKGEQNK